jgi:hypothetical protein
VNSTNRDRFLTQRWNNVLTGVLGLPLLAFAYVGLATDTFSDRATFIGLVVLGAFY